MLYPFGVNNVWLNYLDGAALELFKLLQDTSVEVVALSAKYIAID
ncbi:hypothetical protein ALQ08_01351 [Pseudomonas syringae pv. delphinii]|uniref:Uncharacterized protein n=1 Tax=Pseudomonas syringae pv. delphinii TaxID=192088 RepID=A0A3M4JYP1_9PSED|nr:hypothetical protein ALQ27_00613 [Pseudomonas syringae pv. delphinii]RMQ22107.1 hypothetical protein ALQ08_01351 [Pseudomonas syringae pv. delphinii]